MPDSQLDIFEEIVYGAEDSKEVVIETRRGDLVFDLTRVNRKTRNRVLAALPEGFLDVADDADLGDVDDPSEIDLGDVDTSEMDVSAMTLDDAATDAWDDMLVAGLSHDQLAGEEIRGLVERLPDSVYYEAGAEVLAFSMQQRRIDGFRQRS